MKQVKKIKSESNRIYWYNDKIISKLLFSSEKTLENTDKSTIMNQKFRRNTCTVLNTCEILVLLKLNRNDI